MSLNGTRLLHHVEKKCTEIFPNKEKKFGGICVYLFGDYWQLPPVLDTPAYADRFFDDASSEGAVVFKSFEAFFELRTNHRQSDDHRVGKIFHRLALGEITEDHHKMLSSRAKINLSQE